MLSFKERIKASSRKSRIAACVWCSLYIIFIIWVSIGHLQSLWWLLLLPVIADTFITKYIPWSWWRKFKPSGPNEPANPKANSTLYTIFSWIDAIVFALVAVYFINLFLFQNYQIPSSSLEKSLRVGDFLYVSKAAYGPRIPNTPLSFPLVQHTFPKWLGGGKSFIEHPQWEYRRMKGWREVKKGDIVVFNFPTGDTVCLNMQNPDIYTLRYLYGGGDSEVGRRIIEKRKDVFGEIVYRPVDRRENYVKRCVGTPGDTLQIIDNQIFINGVIEADHEEVQYNYYVQTDGVRLSKDYTFKLGISKDDYRNLNPNTQIGLQEILYVGLDPAKPVYHFPLTREMKKELENNSHIEKIIIEPVRPNDPVFPLGATFLQGDSIIRWTRDNYGPIYLPEKGATITLTTDNYPIYKRVIETYEHSHARIGEQYTFKMDYYWMMGDNRHNSADSRYWGFVPEDHIVGTPRFVWLSIEKDKPWFHGHIRWNRIGRDANK